MNFGLLPETQIRENPDTKVNGIRSIAVDESVDGVDAKNLELASG